MSDNTNQSRRDNYITSITNRLRMRSLEQMRVIDQCISLLDDGTPILKQLGGRIFHDGEGQDEQDIYSRSIWNAAMASAIEIVAVHEARRATESPIGLVRQFHERFEQPINNEPAVDDEAINELRVKLIQEELNELELSLFDNNAVATLDALGDLLYVVYGAVLSLGFGKYIDAATAEIHRSNMTKLGADGRPVYRYDGKIAKGPNYEPPNLAAVLRAPSDHCDDFDSAVTATYERAEQSDSNAIAGRFDMADGDRRNGSGQ